MQIVLLINDFSVNLPKKGVKLSKRSIILNVRHAFFLNLKFFKYNKMSQQLLILDVFPSYGLSQAPV